MHKKQNQYHRYDNVPIYEKMFRPCYLSEQVCQRAWKQRILSYQLHFALACKEGMLLNQIQ